MSKVSRFGKWVVVFFYHFDDAFCWNVGHKDTVIACIRFDAENTKIYEGHGTYPDFHYLMDFTKMVEVREFFVKSYRRGKTTRLVDYISCDSTRSLSESVGIPLETAKGNIIIPTGLYVPMTDEELTHFAEKEKWRID